MGLHRPQPSFCLRAPARSLFTPSLSGCHPPSRDGHLGSLCPAPAPCLPVPRDLQADTVQAAGHSAEAGLSTPRMWECGSPQKLTLGSPWEARCRRWAGEAGRLCRHTCIHRGHRHGKEGTAGSEVHQVMVLSLLWLQAVMSLGQVSTSGLSGPLCLVGQGCQGLQEEGQGASVPGEGVSGESGSSPLQALLGLQRQKQGRGALSDPVGVSMRC